MSAPTDYTKTLLGEFLLTAETVTRPTAWYVALFVDGTEVDGTGYERKAVAFEEGVTPGEFANDAEVDFGMSGSAWGEVDSFGIYTADTGGTLLIQQDFDAPYDIASDQFVKFAAGDLKVIITGES